MLFINHLFFTLCLRVTGAKSIIDFNILFIFDHSLSRWFFDQRMVEIPNITTSSNIYDRRKFKIPRMNIQTEIFLKSNFLCCISPCNFSENCLQLICYPSKTNIKKSIVFYEYWTYSEVKKVIFMGILGP